MLLVKLRRESAWNDKTIDLSSFERVSDQDQPTLKHPVEAPPLQWRHDTREPP